MHPQFDVFTRIFPYSEMIFPFSAYLYFFTQLLLRVLSQDCVVPRTTVSFFRQPMFPSPLNLIELPFFTPPPPPSSLSVPSRYRVSYQSAAGTRRYRPSSVFGSSPPLVQSPSQENEVLFLGRRREICHIRFPFPAGPTPPLFRSSALGIAS